jgi:DNA-binding CsgD family transcriptional regulator
MVEEVSLLGRRGLPRDQYFAEVTARLRRTIASDATCWHTLDPQTGLMTSDVPDELISSGVFTGDGAAAAGERIVASEYLIEDFNTFAGLAGRRVPVGTLSQATRGRPERSARYQDVLAPAGIPFELRAAFVIRGRCWGAVHIARREESGAFGAGDLKALSAVTSAIADGIRTSLRFDAARRPDEPGAPGMVVVNRANQVELMTAPSRALLDALRSAVAPADSVPSPVSALANFARRRAAAGDPQPDVVAIPTPSGWITLHASLPEGRGSGQVAIVLERAASPQTTAMRLEVEGVTPREREIARLLAQGRSNAEIAETLVLSPYTVQDHIKSLFEKTRVGSRQELVARVFLDDYLPELVSRTPLTSAGGFVAAPGAAGDS